MGVIYHCRTALFLSSYHHMAESLDGLVDFVTSQYWFL
jgi:hypothetical protein